MTGLSRPSPSTFTMVIYGRLIELSRRSVGAEYFLPLVRRPTKFPSGSAVPSYSAALQGSQPFLSLRSLPQKKDKKASGKNGFKIRFFIHI